MYHNVPSGRIMHLLILLLQEDQSLMPQTVFEKRAPKHCQRPEDW